MKVLSDILLNANYLQVQGNVETPITGIAFDSREVRPGYAFVAIKGTQADGHQFIGKAIELGAAAVIHEDNQAFDNKEVVAVKVANSAEALAQMACNWYGHPSKKLKLVGVTGTNGKTTIATLLHSVFTELGYKAGLLSTVENKIGTTVVASTHTTPDALAINRLLAEMVAKGCTHAFMEASSHAMHQRRVAGLEFDGAIFTNISHDHLDYHGSFENYIEAKKMLFDGLAPGAFSLVNVDDKRGRVMVQNTRSKVFTYSTQTGASFRARLIANTLQGLHMEVNGKEVWFQLVGEFNAYNLLAVYGAAVLLGEKEEEVMLVLSASQPVRGRFERIPLRSGGVAIVDYAHTPDALQNVLDTIKSMQLAGEQLITVVGCGGNRDKTKRPVMAQVAAKMSTQVILTSDNPRNEEPKTIIQEMLDGVPLGSRRKVAVIEDRDSAIKEALGMAQEADVVLIAGKGHETYQEINGVKYPFDDRQKVLETQTPIRS